MSQRLHFIIYLIIHLYKSIKYNELFIMTESAWLHPDYIMKLMV